MSGDESAESDKLAIALKEAVEQSVRIDADSNLISISASRFVATFKDIWVYQDSQPNPINYEFCTGGFFLLMYKNLSVTNLWPMELLALLRTFSYCSKSSNISDLKHAPISFYSDKEYTEFLRNLFHDTLEALPIDLNKKINPDNELPQQIEKFVTEISDCFLPIVLEYYRDILLNTIIVNKYFSSCLVHVPQSRCVNLKRVIAESGYIHSGGRTIYSRRAFKAEPQELEDQLTIFLDGSNGRYSEKKVYITPYADELFSPFDKATPVSLRNGLEDVKIRIGRHHIAGEPLVDYLVTLGNHKRLGDFISLPQGIKPYAEERRQAKGTEEKCTIWFIVDRAVSDQQSSERILPDEKETYLFVYEQAFINNNQFILFKERKPGWYASVTAPHTMTISLANIVRGAPYGRQLTDSSPPLIIDPFCGTGTVLFDSALRFPNSVIIGFDRSESAIAATVDNAEFFSQRADPVAVLQDLVNSAVILLEKKSWDELVALGQEEAPSQEKSASAKLSYVIKLVDRHILKQSEGESLSKNIKKVVDSGFPTVIHQQVVGGKTSLGTRLLFYSLWRAIALGSFAIRANVMNIPQVAIKELKKVSIELGVLKNTLNGKSGQETEIGGTNFASNIGLYSASLFLSPAKMAKIRENLHVVNSLQDFTNLGNIRNLKPGIWLVKVDDSLDALQNLQKQVDIIITDPPYGFNAKTDSIKRINLSLGKS